MKRTKVTKHFYLVLIGILSFVSILFLAGSFVLWRDTSIDSEQHGKMIHLLDRVATDDTEVNAEIFRIRLGMKKDFDELNKLSESLQSGFAHLEKELDALNPRDSSNVEVVLAELKNEIEAKAGNIEEFQKAHQELRDDLSQLPQLIKTTFSAVGYTKQALQYQAIVKDLSDALTAVEDYQSTELKRLIREKTKALERYKSVFISSRINSQVLALEAQIKKIISDREVVAYIGNKIKSLSIRETAVHLNQEYGNIVVIKAEKNRRYQAYIFLFSCFLLAMIFVLISQLIGMNKKLSQTVVQKTREVDNYFDLSLDHLCIATFDGYLKRINPSWARTLGYSDREILATPFIKFVHEDDREATVDEFKKLMIGESVMQFENRYRTKRGEYRWFSWKAVPVSREKLIYAIARDITDQKLLEMQRNKVDKMKNEFISTVSHELRTPLTSIKGSLGLLSGGIGGQLSEKMKSLVTMAMSNCDRLIRLINDMLDIEKMEAGKIKFKMEELPVSELIEDAIRANEGYAEKFKVPLRIVDPLEDVAKVNGDHDRLMQVLTNLISNAIKFSPENKSVDIKVERLNRMVRFSVIDHGEGISESFKEQIFKKFCQGDSSDIRKVEGTGLGLSISKKIVEVHNGEIGYSSEVGKGTTFYFDIPECGVLPKVIEQGAGDGKRILICEDDPEVSRILSMMLNEAGYRTSCVRTAQQALSLLSETEFDAMTLDIKLPDQGGLSLLDQIKDQNRFKELPVIVVSGNEAHTDVGALPIVDWVEKPIDQDRLLRDLHSVLKNKKKKNSRILHIEDNQDVSLLVKDIAGSFADVVSARTVEEAKRLIKSQQFDLAILDLALPDGNGVELISLLEARETKVPIIIFTAYDLDVDLRQRVEAVLVKTQTTNAELLSEIQKQINAKSEVKIA
jgi:PAS domain S-box-containing protein